jgi:hypothetical protein
MPQALVTNTALGSPDRAGLDTELEHMEVKLSVMNCCCAQQTLDSGEFEQQGRMAMHMACSDAVMCANKEPPTMASRL